jgi:phosphoribosylaminoimidazole-succinocarboxamide synthase
LPFAAPVLTTSLATRPPDRHGKVRDIYDFGDRLLVVATDRISAFDYVLGSGIPDKGRVLTQISAFWFERMESIVGNHLLSLDPADYPADARAHGTLLAGRSMLVR